MRTLKIWCSLLVLFSSFYSTADHLAGGFFEYTHLGNNVYQIDYYFLRDCDGVQADPPELYAKNDCGQECQNLGLMAEVGNSELVDYGCGNTCLFGGDRPGYRLLHYRKNVDLSWLCDSWTFSVAISARNSVDYASGANDFYYNYCRINSTVANNSPDIIGSPVVIGCNSWGSEPLYTIAATDGDQIVFDFVPSMIAEVIAGGGGPCAFHGVTYESGLSESQSFPSTAPFALNPSNGSFSFTPTTNGTSYFAVRAREYRNGVLIGETVADGMIYVDHCQSAGEVTFESFPNSGNATMTVPAEPGTYCQTVTLTSDETIESVTVTAPDFVTHSLNVISGEEVEVTICVDFPEGHNFCEGETIGFVINAISGEPEDCLADANGFPDKGYYYIHRLPGEYCPENLFFTNRNAISGIPMPLYAHAEERIWVGDSMPPIAPAVILANEGPVVVNGDLTLEAGTEIIIPSCESAPCVTLGGNTTLIISPNSCSADCEQEPLDLFVREQFDCFHEQLQAQVSGSGPYNFQWIIKGDTIVTSDSYLFIHDYVSDDSTGQIPYSCQVFDANGNSGSFSGEILGTKSFYKPIGEHTIYFDYPASAPWDPGWYYAGNPAVGQDWAQTIEYLPFYVYDAVNAHGPWYGATSMELIVWDRWGNEVLDYNRDLEGGDDWSFNNGEVYWNGYKFNDLDNPCVCNDNTGEWLNYRLTARNCLTPVHLEQSVLLSLSCYVHPWTQPETKSTLQVEDAIVTDHDSTRYAYLPDTEVQFNDFTIHPNPTDSRLFVKVSDSHVYTVAIVDASGKTVFSTNTVANGAQLDVSGLSAGIYTVIAKSDLTEEKHIKLVKK